MAPILHVNGDDPEAVVHSARIAVEFKQTFKTDVIWTCSVIAGLAITKVMSHRLHSLLCTKKLKNIQALREIYARQLVSEGVISEIKLWIL